ncbi:hypothetical protein LTS18_004679 [Coniosporium uncinatum]|uniref:Uncharacterized protein n=1 Tax=Coniosporium uncinatum TaxID=93489 RepID=A0ACC3DZU4_9PEZI|nr:hypothetical protein LTS18_004679 [Coniosporium uncinatum]
MATEGEPQHVAAQRMYDARAHNYEDSHHPSFAQRIVEMIKPQPGESVLDLACGTGLVTFAAAEAVGDCGRVTGIDVSDGMLKIASDRKSKESEKHQNVSFLKHSITDLESLPELKDRKFDIIACASALVLLEDPLAAVKQWVKFLKPGGRLMADVPHPQNQPGGNAWEITGHWLDVSVPMHRMWVENEGSLPDLLRRAGLEAEDSKFVEHTEAGVTEHDIDEGEELFEKGWTQELTKAIREQAPKEHAKEIWWQEWENMAVGGKVKEVDGVYVVIAQKPGKGSSVPMSALSIDDAGDSVVKGGCRCGNIRYEARGAPSGIAYCHCQACRKLSGAAFMMFADFPVEAVKITLGRPTSLRLSKFAERTYCDKCGSPISMAYGEEPTEIAVTMGSLEDDSLTPETWSEVRRSHIFVREKAPWYEIPDDGLPRSETMKGFEERSKS